MKTEWDVAIPMHDGLRLRADVYRPDDGRHPAILSYGPHAKGLAFQAGYPDQWTTFKNRFTGVGPFRHDDPADRPPAVFGGVISIPSSPDRPATILLPLIPDTKAGSTS